MTRTASRQFLLAMTLTGFVATCAGTASAEQFASPFHPGLPEKPNEVTFPYKGPGQHGPTDVYPAGPGSLAGPYMPPARQKRVYNWFGPSLLNFNGLKPVRVPGTTFRVDYLLWSAEDPGDILVGEQARSDGQDPSTFFAIDTFASTDDGRIVDAAIGPTLGPISLNDNNGARLTANVPTRRHGEFEWSGWVLGESTQGFTLLPTEFFNSSVGTFQAAPALNTLINGQPTDAAILFTSNAQVQYEFDVWGTDVTWFGPSQTPRGPGFHLSPTSGFVYRRIQEDLRLRGAASPTTSDLFTTTAFAVSAVDSYTINHVFGPTFGFRAEFVHQWFTIGVEPAVLLGANSVKAAVSTENVDGLARTEDVDRYFRFSPALELQTYAHIRLTSQMTFFVAYDLMRFGRIFRPGNTIRYDVLTDGGGAVNGTQLAADPVTAINFRAAEDADQMTLDGLSVGLEYRPW